MATSALNIIERAMRIDGIIASLDTPSAQDANDALISLNMMLEQWSIEDLMCYCVTSNNFLTADGTASYTIGVGGVWVTGGRPNEILNAFVRSGNVDCSLKMMSQDEYYAIGIKNTEGIPAGLYYQPEYPLGKVFLYPVPDAIYTVGITQILQFTAFAGLTTTVILPPGYLKALIWNLAVEIAPEYGKPIDEVTAKMAVKSKALIKDKNQKLPELYIESSLLGRGNDTFNIQSGF